MLNAEMPKLKQQNYFPIPNAVFDLDLTDGEILVYAFLLRCEDRRTYQCHPSYTTIGRAIGKSVNSVRKYVQGLTQKGLITTEHTQIITKSGECYVSSECEPRGEAKENIGIDWLSDKFRRITGPVLSKDSQNTLLELITQSNDMPIREIVDTTNKKLGF